MAESERTFDWQSRQEEYRQRAAEIRKHCACPSEDARECMSIRYPPPTDDCFRAEWFNSEHEECECVCHEELAELEREIFGPDHDF